MTEHAALQTARWLRLRTLFDAAFDLPVLARTRLLEQLREEDTLLADELAALLAAADASDDTGVRAADLRARVLGELGVLGATVPEQAGAFTIGDEIGRGGMGVVYRGHRSDGVMDQPVAVKFLHAGALAAAEQDRLLRECRTLSALDHPGVARILDAGRTSDGRAYLAMELVEGKPLIEWCDEHRLGLRARVELFLKVCAAVEHAHQRLVLHSDIKSSNVLVANGQPKLIDFGIARSLATDGDATQTLSRHFSPANVTPEQLRGERLGVACDVYQLGALLHELLCGQRVHTATSANLESLRKAVIDEVPPAPSQRVVDVHPDVLATRGLGHADALASELKGDLDAIVGRCLRKPAGERYRSVEALESDLRAYLTLQPVQARGGESWYRFRRFLARNRLPVALGALAASAVLALVAMGAFHVLRINAALAQAAAERDVAEQVTEFMIEAFRSADPNHSLQPETSVGEVLTRAGQLLATRDLATEPKVRMLRALAQAQFGVSDFLTAVKTLESADELYSQVARGSSARVQAEIAAQRARVLQELGRCEEALVHAGRAIDLFRSNGNGLDIQLGTRHVVIVCNRQVLGWETALAQTKALLVEMETASDLPLRERAAFEITAVKYLRDEEGTRAEGVPLGRALALIDGSIERLEAAGPEFRVEAILARLQRADLLEANHGRFEEAEAQIRQVITDIREVLGERTPSLGLAYNALGNVLKAQDRLDEAVEAYRKSLEVYDGSYQTPHASQVAPLINIGFVHQIQERNDLALEAFEAARARALRDPENLGSILEFATSILAELMQAEGRWQESVDMLLQMPDEPTNGLRIKIRRQFGLIRAYLELGDRPAARQAFSVVEPLFVSGEVKDRKLLEDVEGFRALLELPQEQSQTERGGG